MIVVKVTVLFNFDRYIMIPGRAKQTTKNETLTTLEYFNSLSKEEKEYYNQRYGQDPQ